MVSISVLSATTLLTLFDKSQSLKWNSAQKVKCLKSARKSVCQFVSEHLRISYTTLHRRQLLLWQLRVRKPLFVELVLQHF